MAISQGMLDKLIATALQVRAQAYAPYSGFQVGAAVLADNGQIYQGCNVENASYGLTICAERSAVFSMITSGGVQIEAIALALPGAGTPCGACRQVLAEFGRGFPVYLIDSTNGLVKSQWDFEALLPAAFRPSSLDQG